jgi:ABC-2 type transport system ATP-binding protein
MNNPTNLQASAADHSALVDHSAVAPSRAVPTAPMVQMVGVTKTYKHFQLHPVDLTLHAGTVMGLVGPNGAGKSTIMRIMMGLVNPASGSVEILGQGMSSNSALLKREIGYFSDDMRLYKAETLGWHMQLVRSLYPNWDQAYAQSLLTRFGLIDQQPIKGLSHGQRVKAMLLLLLARRPKLLILDEPTNGLDPVVKQEVLAELMEVMTDETRAIIYSSHQTQDVEQISDWLTFIDRGRVIASDNRDDFLDQWRRIKLRAPQSWNWPAIRGLRQESQLQSFRALTVAGFNAEVTAALTDTGAEVESVEPMTLEEIFVEVVLRGRERDTA